MTQRHLLNERDAVLLEVPPLKDLTAKHTQQVDGLNSQVLHTNIKTTDMFYIYINTFRASCMNAKSNTGVQILLLS